MTTLDEEKARRTAIQLCVQTGLMPTDTFQKLKSTERYGSVSRSLVFKWHGRFSDGWADSAQRGRKPYKDVGNIKAAKDVIDGDRRETVRDVSECTGISKSSVQRILKSDLKMTHVSARWVPRLLTEEEKRARVVASRAFLRKVERDCTFLSRIITTDETWVHYYEPEDKRMSMVWKNHDSPPPKKAKVVKSIGKVMYMVFLDMRGVVLVHMVKAGRTVNAAYYSETIRRDLMNALRKKRPDLYNNIENIIFHQDNAPSHTACKTQLEIGVLGFQRVVHPPYSPDLAPLDFSYFPQLKAHLRGNHFQDRDEVMQAIQQFNRSLVSGWFSDVYQKWVKRHRKCVTLNGEYFEKQ